jgi:hypothetical protein
MARTDQGNALTTKQLQPGSRFVKTRSGFDTGFRSWEVDADSAESECPVLGEPDATYKGMFVDQVELENKENNIVLINANYLGLIDRKQGKPAVIEEEADSEMASDTPTLAGINPIRAVSYFRPIPRVIVTYVTDKRKPSITRVGEPMVPPGYEKEGPSSPYYKAFQNQALFGKLFEGWILRNRSIRVAGIGNKGRLFEVRDTYTFETLNVELQS